MLDKCPHWRILKRQGYLDKPPAHIAAYLWTHRREPWVADWFADRRRRAYADWRYEHQGHAARLDGMTATSTEPIPATLDRLGVPRAPKYMVHRQIAGLIAMGLTQQQVAQQLGVSQAGVSRRLGELRRKMTKDCSAQGVAMLDSRVHIRGGTGERKRVAGLYIEYLPLAKNMRIDLLSNMDTREDDEYGFSDD